MLKFFVNYANDFSKYAEQNRKLCEILRLDIIIKNAIKTCRKKTWINA